MTELGGPSTSTCRVRPKRTNRASAFSSERRSSDVSVGCLDLGGGRQWRSRGSCVRAGTSNAFSTLPPWKESLADPALPLASLRKSSERTLACRSSGAFLARVSFLILRSSCLLGACTHLCALFVSFPQVLNPLRPPSSLLPLPLILLPNRIPRFANGLRSLPALEPPTERAPARVRRSV